MQINNRKMKYVNCRQSDNLKFLIFLKSDFTPNNRVLTLKMSQMEVIAVF